MTKVSVIIPVYNTAKYLDRCLSSVLDQSLVDNEIITVIDASPDDSLAIVQRFQRDDARIKIIQNSNNKGLPATRNVGVSHASGEYIIHLDSDDFWLNKDMLDELYTRAQADGCEMLRFNGYNYQDGALGSLIENELDIVNGNVNQDRKLWSYRAVFLFFMQKRFIDKHNLSFTDGLNIGEDAVFLSAALFAAQTISSTSKCYYAYRINQSSMMNRAWTYQEFMQEEDSSQIISHNIQSNKEALYAYLYSRIKYYWPQKIASKALPQLTWAERIKFYQHVRTNFSRLALINAELHESTELSSGSKNTRKLYRYFMASDYEQVDKHIAALNSKKLVAIIKKKIKRARKIMLKPLKQLISSLDTN